MIYQIRIRYPAPQSMVPGTLYSRRPFATEQQAKDYAQQLADEKHGQVVEVTRVDTHNPPFGKVVKVEAA